MDVVTLLTVAVLVGWLATLILLGKNDDVYVCDFSIAVMGAALLGGCAGIPDRLDAFADAGREFAVVHPALTGAALIAARAALRKPQHLRVMCNPHCRLGSSPPPRAGVSAAFPPR